MNGSLMFKKKEQNGFFGQFNQSDLSIDLFNLFFEIIETQ